MRRNVSLIALGVFLMAASFVGVFWMGQRVNPPTLGLVVAAGDIAPGTSLAELLAVDGLRVDDRARLSPETTHTLLTEGDIGRLADGVIVQAVAAGQPIPLVAISAVHNPAGAELPALLLNDPALVAMAIPVSLITMPGRVQAGDFVDVVFASTGAGPGAALLPDPSSMRVAGEGRGLSAAEYESLQAETESTDAAYAPRYYLPVAKTIVTHAQVLEVVRDSRGAQIGPNGQALTGLDPPVALVVVVPRDAQEIVQFAVENGSLRVTLLSATLHAETTPIGTRYPTLGMTWNDLVALLELERESRLRDGAPAEVLGPGATAILPLLPHEQAESR